MKNLSLIPIRRLAFGVCSFLMLWMICSGSMPAQSTYGTITGIVTDPAGAVIPLASVEVLNQDSGATRTATTNDQGVYLVPDLEPGTYTITATAAQLVPAKNENVKLLARETARSDIQLQIQGATEKVEVTDTQAAVSEDTTLSSSTSGQVINSFALNFRATANPSPIVVANLAPNVQSDSSGNLTVSGQLPTATSFSLDGISTQSPRYGGPTRDLFPSVEGIGEFKVNSAGNDAEFSQPTDLTVTSRSGTNDFHGSGFWYLQRKDFNARDGISGIIPTGDANTFGVSLGGPVWIPKIYNGRNKSFFFFDYEGVRLDQSTFISTNTPPTQWRNGDFSGAGESIGSQFPGNKIQPSQINPVSAKILPLFFPSPTNPEAALTTNNFTQAYPGNYTNDGFDGRFDQNFGEKHRVWVRVTQKTISAVGTDAALGAGGSGDTTYNPLMGPFSTLSDLTNIAGSYTWIISPSLINEFRGGYSRSNFSFSYPQAQQGDSIIASLGITGLPGSPKNGLGGVPVFYLSDFLGGQTNPYGHPRLNKNGVLQFGDNLSWIVGNHDFRYGFEFRRYNYQDNITFLLGDEYGDYFFNGDEVQSFANFLLGNIGDAKQAQNGPDGKPYGYHYGGFAQDEWRIKPNFTLHYGLRYEVNTPFNDETNQLGNFDRNYPGGRLVVQGTKGLSLVNPLWKVAVGNTPFVTNSQVGLPYTLRNTYYSNIQPRLGFSWSPGSSGKTTIRASSGFYSVPVLGAVNYSLLGVDTSYFADYPSTAGNQRTFPNVFNGSNAPPGNPSYRRANDFNLRDPRVIQWNFAIDQSVGESTVARVSYIGSHAYNLIYSPDLNQVAPNTVGYAGLTATPALRQQNLRYPQFAEVLTRDNGPSAKYEALTLELNRRFAKNLMFSNNYTWAHNDSNALGTAPSSAIPTGGQGDNGGNVNNYYNIASDTGNAYYTRRHRFVSTFVYDLPFGRGQKFASHVGRGSNLLVGGWRLTGVTLLQSGPWLTPYFPSNVSDPSGTNPSQRSVSQQRPDCIAGRTGYLANPTVSQYFDSSAFSVPARDIGRFGNCGVGILEGPGTVTLSMSAGKTFQLTERLGVRYEAQFANLLNIRNKNIPNLNVNSASFGQITQSQGVEQGGPRTIQMMLRILF
jgi:Carboxypeptidase regulatory-like domain